MASKMFAAFLVMIFVFDVALAAPQQKTTPNCVGAKTGKGISDGIIDVIQRALGSYPETRFAGDQTKELGYAISGIVEKAICP